MKTYTYFRFVKTRGFLFAAGLIVGALVILGVRFATYKSDDVHYHANFALYINGQRELFQGQQYYEETEMCSAHTVVTPDSRAHMHDNVNNVVHVEDHAVTWGQFFANLGWYIGPDFAESPTNAMYKEDGSAKLHILLNGQDYTDLGGIANTVIKDQDKLLLSFGDQSNAVLQQEYNAIPSTAHHYDVTPDPETCSSGHSSTMSARFKHMF